MSDFSWDIKHYPTVADYQAALLPFPKPTWISGVTVHQTWRPTRAQWAGHRTMVGLGNFYERKGWSAGPHLFLAALTSGPFTDGIWAGTPLADPGVHAGTCNADHIGVEVVGDYDAEPWPAAVSDLVYDVLTLFVRWGNIPISRVHGHRECLPNKSCPGTKIDMDQVRRQLAARMPVPRYRIPRVPIREQPSTSANFLGYLSSDTEYGIRIIDNGWGKLVSQAGWVQMSDVERVP